MLSVTSSARKKCKIGVEGGICTRTSLILTRFSPLRVSSFRHSDILGKLNTDGEIRTHITLFLRQVPLPLGYVGAKYFV